MLAYPAQGNLRILYCSFTRNRDYRLISLMKIFFRIIS